MLFIFFGFVSVTQADEKAVFDCGQWPTFYHVMQKPDGGFIAFTATQSFAPAPITPVKVAVLMEAKNGKCSVTVQEPTRKMNFSFDFDKGVENLRYLAPPTSTLSEKARECVVQDDFKASFKECKQPKSNPASVEVETPERDLPNRIDFYNCAYSDVPRRVKAREHNLRILKKNSDGMACIAKVGCEMQTSVFDLAWPPHFDTWVACLPTEGSCSRSYEECKGDDDLEFIDDSVAGKTIKKALNIEEAAQIE